MAKQRRLLRTGTAARILNLSTESTRRLRDEMEYEVDSGGQYLFTEESVRKFAERRKRTKKPEAFAAA